MSQSKAATSLQLIAFPGQEEQQTLYCTCVPRHITNKDTFHPKGDLVRHFHWIIDVAGIEGGCDCWRGSCLAPNSDKLQRNLYLSCLWCGYGRGLHFCGVSTRQGSTVILSLCTNEVQILQQLYVATTMSAGMSLCCGCSLCGYGRAHFVWMCSIVENG